MTVLGADVLIMSQLGNRSMLVEDVPGFNNVDECPGFDQLKIFRRRSLINAHFPIPSKTVARSGSSSDIGSTHIRRPRR